MTRAHSFAVDLVVLRRLFRIEIHTHSQPLKATDLPIYFILALD